MRLLTPLCCLLTVTLFGQPDFTRYYDYGGTDRFTQVIQLSDSLLVAVGSSRDSEDLSRAIVSVLDTAGETRRSFTIDYPLRTIGTAVARQSDTTFWFGAWRTPQSIIDDWVVYRVNAVTGVAEGFGWGAPTIDEQIRAMAPTPEGGVLVVGNTGSFNEAIISRLDAAGNELFRRTFTIPGNRFTVATDVELLPGGDIIISGQYDPNDGAGGQDAGFFLVRLTGAGELVWSRRYGPPDGWNVTGNVKMVVLPDGGFAVTGTQKINNVNDVFLSYINGGGELEHSLVSGTFFFTARDIVLSRSGDLVVVGNSILDEELIRGMTLKFRRNDLQYFFEDFVGYGFRTNFSGIINRADNGFYVSGSGTCGNDALILSLDASLQDTVASCFISQQIGDWESGAFTTLFAGELTNRNDPRFTPQSLTTIVGNAKQEYCAKISLEPAALPHPVCYNQPIRLLDTARQISPGGSIVFMLITMGADAGAGEGLFISNVPNNVTILGNGTEQIRLELTGAETGAVLTTLLSRIQYVNAGVLTQTITRRIAVYLRSNCKYGEGIESIFFTVAPANPTFSPLLTTDTVLCTNQSLTLCAPEQPGLAYAWSTGDTTACTTIAQPGNYGLIRSTACAADTSAITVNPTDIESLLPEQTTETLCLGDSLVVAPALPPGVTAAWTDSFPNLTRSIRTAGTFSLERSNACGTALTTIDVRTTDCCELYLPTAFSPNGDGVNDRFRAFPNTTRCRLVTDYQLTVYDRWGGLVYSGTTPTDGWDGQVASQPAATGYYVFALRYFNGLVTVERSGGFTLVR